MRLFVRDLADDRAVVILPVRHDDAGILAHPAAPAVRGDQQRSRQLFAILQQDIDAMLAALAGRDLRRHVQRDPVMGLNRFEQQPAQHGIFDHDAHRALVLAGHEIQRAGLEPVVDQDLLDIAAVRAEFFGQANGIEHLPAGAVDRRHPGVILRVEQVGRVGPVDDRHLQPVRRQRQRLGQADHARAQYDDIAIPRIKSHEDRLSELQTCPIGRHRRRGRKGKSGKMMPRNLTASPRFAQRSR